MAWGCRLSSAVLMTSMVIGWTHSKTDEGQEKVSWMTADAEALLEVVPHLSSQSSDMRFKVAVADMDADHHGAYGEFPVENMAKLLTHPAVLAQTEAQDSAGFVDIGSGAGRLLLAVAAMMQGTWTVAGIEASEVLHLLATDAITTLEDLGKLKAGSVKSVHADSSAAAAAPFLVNADIVFCYSTAFPSDDGLRLPELSATLAATLPEGAIAITTDKWLVGERFAFEDLVVFYADGDEGDFPTLAFVWRMLGNPIAGGAVAALADIETQWMEEDACAISPLACEAMMDALGLDEEVDTDL